MGQYYLATIVFAVFIGVLSGGRGRDILIGGAGLDRITSGDGENLLIAGTTAYDASDEMLDALFEAWTAPTSYGDRVNQILDPGFSAPLGAGTVFDDAASDRLIGNSGRQWFWANSNDLIIDRGPPDLIERI